MYALLPGLAGARTGARRAMMAKAKTRKKPVADVGVEKNLRTALLEKKRLKAPQTSLVPLRRRSSIILASLSGR
jgi:hypothetical protein